MKKISKNGIITILISLIFFSMNSCTTWEGKKYPNRKKPKNSDQTQQDKVIKRPSDDNLAMASNPARNASMNIANKGKVALNANELERALSFFREAVIIDGTNGIAYYYMAKTRFLLKQYEEALGILDKAETLLASNDDWIETISILRVQIRAEANSYQP